MADGILDCGGVYEVHPATGGGWAVVNGVTGHVRCELTGRDVAATYARELNAGGHYERLQAWAAGAPGCLGCQARGYMPPWRGQ